MSNTLTAETSFNTFTAIEIKNLAVEGFDFNEVTAQQIDDALYCRRSFNTRISTWIKEARSLANRGNAKGLPKGWVVVGGGRSAWFVADENDNLVAQGADLAATLRTARKEA